MEPIRAGLRDKNLGLGKQEQDDRYTAQENVQRKKLETEIEETEEIAKKREVSDNRCTHICAALPAGMPAVVSWDVSLWCGEGYESDSRTGMGGGLNVLYRMLCGTATLYLHCSL